MNEFDYVATTLESARQRRGMTKAELARRALMNPDYLGKSLRGDRVLRADEAARLCVVLDVKLGALITEDELRRMHDAIAETAGSRPSAWGKRTDRTD